MKKLVLIISLLLSGLAFANPPGTFQPLLLSTTYIGPGDVVPGAIFWGGLRAYSSASRGTKAVNVCLPADTACSDFFSDATTGQLVITTISGSSCDNSTVICTVKTVYDQTGNGKDFTNAGGVYPRIIFRVNCSGSLPCMEFTMTGNASGACNSSFYSTAQPYTIVGPMQRTGDFSALSLIFSADNVGLSAGGVIYGYTSPNTAAIFSTSPITAAMTDSAFHSLIGIFNGVSSSIVVDSTATTGNPGTATLQTTACIGRTFNANYGLIGYGFETGVWASAFNSTQYGNMNTNIHSFWGF